MKSLKEYIASEGLSEADGESAQLMSKADIESLVDSFSELVKASSNLKIAQAVCMAAEKKVGKGDWRRMAEGFARIKETIDHFTGYHKEEFHNMARNSKLFFK